MISKYPSNRSVPRRVIVPKFREHGAVIDTAFCVKIPTLPSLRER
jgi:hypothetical protein